MKKSPGWSPPPARVSRFCGAAGICRETPYCLDLDLVPELDVDTKKLHGIMLTTEFAKAYLERLAKVLTGDQVHVLVEVQVQVE
jgi:hypothetical protein